MSEVWVLASDKLEGVGMNTDVREVKLNIEGAWNSGPLSPAFLSEDDAWDYKRGMCLTHVSPVRLGIWTPDMGIPQSEEGEEQQPPVDRKEFLEKLLPELNKLFGLEYKKQREIER